MRPMWWTMYTTPAMPTAMGNSLSDSDAMRLDRYLVEVAGKKDIEPLESAEDFAFEADSVYLPGPEKELMAHELTHVVQSRGLPDIESVSDDVVEAEGPAGERDDERTGRHSPAALQAAQAAAQTTATTTADPEHSDAHDARPAPQKMAEAEAAEVVEAADTADAPANPYLTHDDAPETPAEDPAPEATDDTPTE